MLPGDRPITMLPADAVETGKPSAWSSQAALSFVVLFGIANLFADTSYEGARSVTGPFLGTLGASGLIVGTVAGLRELLGYTLRFISGRWADRSRLYWSITLLGYSVHSGISGCRKLAACRRAYRARAGGEGDAHLSARCDAGTGRRGYGRGWAFGLNEALDQLGAMIGPLIIAAALAWRQDFQVAFALLALPAVVTLSVVFAARFIYPNAGRVVRRSQTVDQGRYPLGFWWYVIAASLVGFGFADFSLLA